MFSRSIFGETLVKQTILNIAGKKVNREHYGLITQLESAETIWVQGSHSTFDKMSLLKSKTL